MALNTGRADGKADSRSGTRIIVIAVITLVLFLLVVFFGGKKPLKEETIVPEQKRDSGIFRTKVPDTSGALSSADTAFIAHGRVDTAITGLLPGRHRFPKRKGAGEKTKDGVDSEKAAAVAVDSVRVADSTAAADSAKAAQAAIDSAGAPAPADTVTDDSDAVFFGGGASADCANDTVVPWVYPEPSGGLYHGSLSIRLLSNKKCAVSWRTGNDTVWQRYNDRAIPLEKTATIFFKAMDRCGRSMKERQEYFEIERSSSSGVCPQAMELVRIGTMRFCIDRYEWPNRKGVVPQSYITLYQARDSCFSAKKRLCTSEEWALACSGPYSWKYPYGQNYESRACITADTAARPSGSKPECRAFFGAFDMSGNLLEWTNTASRGNPGFYNVAGGFWQSGVRSGCFDIRSSYFPQNRHNPVGFRCCKDAPEGDRGTSSGQ